MSNEARANYWANFIYENGNFPEPEKLRRQFLAAKFSGFCKCGCNSFKVQVPEAEKFPPLATPGKAGAFFECAFRLSDKEKTLEIILFANEDGYLSYVEVDCCGNSEPVPESIDISERPYHVHYFE